MKEKIIEIIKENCEDQTMNISLESNLTEDLGIDSFSTLMIVNAIEDEFEITIDPDNIKDVKSVGEIVEKIENELQKK